MMEYATGAQLQQILEEAENIVFFGGAGVSTDSGIPDFRSETGLYREELPDEESPETILSERYLRQHPEKFFRYYRSHMIYPDAEPNAAHYAIAALEHQGKLSTVITQNIDGLHQAAGSQKVIELHGSINRNYCVQCGKQYPVSFLLHSEGVPHCSVCGGMVRPDVVLYGEGLNGEVFGRAEEAISEADTLIVAGTSLAVQPAASLIDLFEGEHLVIINQSETPYDAYAELVIRDRISDVLHVD